MAETPANPIPRSLADAFWGAIGKYDQWNRGEPEPTAGGDELSINLICDLVMQYESDRMPDALWRLLESVAARSSDALRLAKDHSYASGARCLAQLIREKRERFSRPYQAGAR